MADPMPFKLAPEEKKSADNLESLQEKKQKAAIKFQKTWRGFHCRKQHRDLLVKLDEHRKVPKTAEPQRRTIKSIIKTRTEENLVEAKRQSKKVRFKESSPEAPSGPFTRPKSQPKELGKKKKTLIPKPPSEEEVKDDIQKRLEKALTNVGNFIKKEAGVDLKKIVPRKAEVTSISSLSQLDRVDVTRFIQRGIISNIISKALLYGESLLLSKQIQHKYENRPVPKNVFALSHEFQYPVTEPLPHSLHCVSSLGRILYLESLGHLQQIDVMTENRLSPYFLGIRMPLRYTPLIDAIVDTKSCRVYTLNALWKLEVWSLEQPSSLPIKRVPMVNCEVTKDFVEQAYKARHMQAKPTFLSISESANQILVVNTSCVDGNIVFVDPISLSILKRIHFVFSDYEIPPDLKDGIDRLVTCLCSAVKKPEEAFDLLKSLPNTAPLTYSELINKLRGRVPALDVDSINDILRDLDIENTGYISMDNLLPYINEDLVKEPAKTSTIVWPEWVIVEGKVFLVKQALAKVIESVERQNIPPLSAFSIFDSDSTGYIENDEFGKVVLRLSPEVTKSDLELITRLADMEQNGKVEYAEFCRLLDKNLLKSDPFLEEAERILREPLKHKNDLPTLIRKCFENGINLRELFKKEDKFKQGLIERDSLYQILEKLPLGYSPQDIYEIFRDSTIFDAHGNADYTIILQHEVYCILEKLKHQRETQGVRQTGQNSIHSLRKSYIDTTTNLETTSDAAHQDKTADSRKVVIEDVIFLYDFDIVIYTTVFPKSSNIYISHTIPLHAAGHKSVSLFSPSKGKQDTNSMEEMTEEVLKYKFLATLKGHKNSSPPVIHYVEETGCLLSGEKDEKEPALSSTVAGKAQEKLYAPSLHPSVTAENVGEEKSYENHTLRVQRARTTEVLVWNLQKDLIHMMQANPPWTLRPTYRINAHNGSIMDISYLPSAQLIATASTDQTIRFFDPIAAPYSLTEPRKFPLVATKPGYYIPLEQEGTATNPTFHEVRRIYTAPMTPYKLQALNLASTSGGNLLEKEKGGQAGSIEWLVALKLAATSTGGSKKQPDGVVSGYGIERVRLMVPAIRHDDPVPETVHQECESEAQEKRKKAVVAFQSILPYNLEHLLANVALQTSQTNRLSELFKEAMLNRATGKYMVTKPLKEVFQILLEIPERKKYGHIIKEKGRGLVLSVSEVYFYLKKYFQIHPTNLSQVMFAKLVKAFNEDQNKSLIGGIRKWHKEELNVFAGHVRKYGISKDLLGYAEPPNDFLTRVQFMNYLKSLELRLSDAQLEMIANEVDPMGGDRITYQHIQHMLAEEIKQYNIAMFRRPNPIIEEIRGKIIPHKKLRLHEALGCMDKYGDGYITKDQFKEAFSRAGVEIEKETLSYFFDMTSEKFAPRDNEKVLSITTFIRKVLTENESKEFKEIIELFGKLAASLSYRGMDLDVVFADAIFSRLDYTAPVEKHLDLLQVDEFLNRLDMLQISQLSIGEAKRVAGYLSANDKKDGYSVIYFGNYMHHMICLPSADKAEPAPVGLLVAVICGKLLASESMFLKQCHEVAELVNDYIEPSDLRSVLLAKGINVKTADLFVEYITNGQSLNMADLIVRMKKEAILKYKTRYELFLASGETDIPFINFQEVLREVLGESKADLKDLVKKCRNFDKLGNERIKIFHLLNILKHNLRNIEEITLAGLQYELTLIHPDEYIDYKQFLMQYLVVDAETPKSPVLDSKKEKLKKTFNELLQRIKASAVSNKLDIGKVFSTFDSDNDGKISKQQLERALDWFEIKPDEEELECLLTMLPKDSSTDGVLCFELTEYFMYAFELCPYYNKQQWQAAARKANLPEQCRIVTENVQQLEFLVRKEVARGNVISKELFVNSLKELNLGLSEEDIQKLTEYAITGSLNPDSKEDATLKPGLLNFAHFVQSLGTAFEKGGWSEHKWSISPIKTASNKHKEEELIKKVTGHFIKTGLGFHDYFEAEYGGKVPTLGNYYITKSDIINAIKVLQIPLSLQEQRLVIQLSNIDTESKIKVTDFCKQFDSPELGEKRKTRGLRKVAEAVLLKGISLDSAFESLNKEKKDQIAKKDFLELLSRWEIGLDLFELKSMLKPMVTKQDNVKVITKEKFNEVLATFVLSSKERILSEVKESLVWKLHTKLSLELGKSITQFEDLFVKYDYKKNGTIYVDTLTKILEELHMTKISKKELGLILEAGNVDSVVELAYRTYCQNLRNVMQKLKESRQAVYLKVVEHLFSMIKTRKISFFDAYCQLNVLRKEGISKIELITSLQNIPAEQIDILWDTVQVDSKITYHSFLSMFVKAGLLQIPTTELTINPEKVPINTEYTEKDLVGLFSKVRRKKLDWEKVFRLEKETNRRTINRGLSKIALSNCLRKLQLGLKMTEIDALINVLTYKANVITAEDFVKQVETWASKGTYRATQSAKIKSYLIKLSNALKAQEATLEVTFAEVDRDKDGIIDILEHQQLLLKLNLDFPKSYSTEVFQSLTDSKLPLHTLKKALESLDEKKEVEYQGQVKEVNSEEVVYEKIKEQFLAKETSVQNVFLKLKIDPVAAVTGKGIRKLFESIELVLTAKELTLLDNEIKSAFGKDEYSYQDLLDFMIRKRIDPGYTGMEPGIVICMNAVSKVLKKNGINYAKAYSMFSKNYGAYVSKRDFVEAINGMQLGLSIEDILLFFNYIDKTKTGEVTKTDFLNAWAYAGQMSGAFSECSGRTHSGSNTLAAQNAKVGQVLKKLGDIFEKNGYTLRQIAGIFDPHGTGVITKAELTGLLRQRNIEISLKDVRVLTEYLANMGYGRIYTNDLMAKLQEILNQATDGLYSVQQARPIIKKIVKEIEGELSILSEEILKYDKIIELDETKGDIAALSELVNKSGIEKHNFYKLLGRFGVTLSEDEKSVLGTAFGFTSLPNMLDTHKLMNMLESLPTAETSKKQQYTLEWERRIHRKLGNYLRARSLTLQDCFAKSMDLNGIVPVDKFMETLRGLDVCLNEKEILTITNLAKGSLEGKVDVKRFAKQFYETYLLDAESANMTKEEEEALVLRVIQKLKEKSKHNCEKAFAELDKKQMGFLTVTGLQFGLPQKFDLHLTRDQLLVVLRYMDWNDDGMVSLKEFSKFYNDFETELLTGHADNYSKPAQSKDVSLNEIFDALLTMLKDKGLTLFEIFEQLDNKKHGYITMEEFMDLLQIIGIILPEQKVAALLAANDPHFTGKVSYRLLHKLSRAAAERRGVEFEEWGDEEIFKWRDRAVEMVIKGLNATKKQQKEYFEQYDMNSDGLLTLREFRESLKQLRATGTNITRGQIDRLLLLFAVNNQGQQTAVSINKIVDFLAQYSASPFYAPSQPGKEEILVNEDMFVMIVQHFDGFSVLLNKAEEICEKAQYVLSHKGEFFTRGCSLLANALMLERLKKGSEALAMNLKDAMVHLSSHELNLIKGAALSSIVDPLSSTHVKPVIEPDTDIVKTYSVPEIDPKILQLDRRFKGVQKNGYTCYKGTLVDTNQPVRILVYPSQVLNKQSADGKVYWRHLEVELAAQAMIYNVNPDSTFKIIGKYEKRKGIGEYSTDVCVVLEDIPELEYICLEKLLSVNGGLLQLPLLKNTETALYIAKQWARDILTLLTTLHSHGLIMRALEPSHLYLNRKTLRLYMGHFFGIGKTDAEGKLTMCPDLNTDANFAGNSSTLAPEHLFRKFTEHTKDIDTWSFGGLLFEILMGTPPPSYIKMYKEWFHAHQGKELKAPLVQPSSISFVYDPLSAIEIDIKDERINVIEPYNDSKTELENSRKKCKNTLNALQKQSYSVAIEGLSSSQKLGGTVGHKTTAQLIEAMTAGTSHDKSILGLMLDTIACCLDSRPQNRPALNSLLESPIFAIDGYEKSNAVRFADTVFFYKDPFICITKQITVPLREMCLNALKHPQRIIQDLEPKILATIHKLAEYIYELSIPHLRATHNSLADPSKITAPHVALAQRIVSDHVIEMLIFLCHRYTKQWNVSKTSQSILKREGTSKPERATSAVVAKRTQKGIDEIMGGEEDILGSPTRGKKVRFVDDSGFDNKANSNTLSEQNMDIKKRTLSLKFKSDNLVLSSMCGLLHEAIKEMQYKESVLAPYVGKVLEYVVKLLIGEDYVFASDLVQQERDKDFLSLKTFLRNKADFKRHFVPDALDKAWYMTHCSKRIINYETFWNYQSYLVVLPLYQDCIGVAGRGSPKYPVVAEYIASCDNISEVYSMFGKRANKLYGQLLGASKRTSEYYAEVLRLCQNISMLTEKSYGKAAKGSALGDICAMLYGGSTGRIRAALDLRIAKYLIPFMQHPEEEIRKKCALVFCQLSRALVDDDVLGLLGNLQIIGKSASSTTKKSLHDTNKDWSLVGYINNQASVNDPVDTKRYIAFAYDLPSVHFQQNRKFMTELAGVFLNPMLAASLVRQIKSPTEILSTKSVILKTFTHVFASSLTHIRPFESALADLYPTLAKVMVSLSGKEKRLESTLVAEIKQFFHNIFALRNPKVLDRLKQTYGIKGLLRQAGLKLPKLKSLAELAATASMVLSQPDLTEDVVENLPQYIKDFKAMLMHGLGKCTELTVKRECQKVVDMLFKIADVLWQIAENSKARNRMHIIAILQDIFGMWDWLCINKGLHTLVVNAMSGKMIRWCLSKLSAIFSEFRRVGEENPADYLSESLYNRRKIKKAERIHKYETLPLLPLSIPLQHIISVFVQLNDPDINERLEKANFGHIFGEHLQLQYEFLKLAMDSETERLGLLDVYVEQNSNRLSTIEYLLKSKSATLKTQFLKSRFIEKMAVEYVKDDREFSVKFNKIDLKFLAYRHSYPIRNEAISIMSEILKNKENAYELYTELIQRLYRHQVIYHESNIVKAHAEEVELKVQTALVFFSVLLQAGEDVDRGFKDEGVTESINVLLRAKPVLQRQFPMLTKYFALR